MGTTTRSSIFKSPAYVRDDLERGKRAIRNGRRRARLRCSALRTAFVARGLHRSPVNSARPAIGGWSLGVWDSDCPGVDAIVQRKSEPGVTAGSILLLHDGDGYTPIGDRMQTALAVPKIIDQATG